MNAFYDKINKKSGGKFARLRFPEVEFIGGRAAVTVLYTAADKDAVKASAEEIRSLVAETCGFNAPVSVAFKQQDESEAGIKESVKRFMSSIPYVAPAAKSVEVSGTTVKIKMHEQMLALAKNDFFPKLKEYLSDRFLFDIKVETEKEAFAEPDYDAPDEPVASAPAASEPVKRSQTPPLPKRTEKYIPTGLKPVYGEFAPVEAISAAMVDGYDENVAVCGVLAMATEYTSKGSGPKSSRPYEKFLLYDGEHTLQCRFFPRDFTLVRSKYVNTPVCVFGNTELERSRIGEASMTVRAVASCTADGLKAFKPPAPPKKYTCVTPKPYSEYVQASLFNSNISTPSSLNGTFVAFDFETTGLSVVKDKPTELGAVKIVDGIITETFHTLIDPEQPIPEEVSKKTGITDDMVRGQPLFEEVLPDFYKFCHGAALIGHNIAFDFPFLIKYGNRFGWYFGAHATFDTLGLAPRAIPGIEQLTLNNVLEKLGLVNDNAHRALSDATATAKAFIAMKTRLAQ